MKNSIRLSCYLMITFLLSSFFVVSCAQKPETTMSLPEAYAGKFYIGTAMNAQQITGRDTAGVRVIKEIPDNSVHFNIFNEEWPFTTSRR